MILDALHNYRAQNTSRMNKSIGIGMAAFAVIEAVITFFLVMKPLFINPVYKQAADYNAEGKTCIVKLFGKTFASQSEIANNQIILTLWDTILNVALIYLIISGILLVLSFCYFKGFAFAKSYLIAIFGAKTIIGLIPLLIPFAKLAGRNSIKAFGIVDAVLCLAACVYFVYESNDEYADDMLLTENERLAMVKRAVVGVISFFGMAAVIVLTNFALSAYGSITIQGGNWSIITGWVGGDTGIAQGIVLLLLMAVSLIGSILYVREGEWAMLYYFAFGAATAVVNISAIVLRFIWVVKTYNPIKACFKAGDASDYTEIFANRAGYNPFAVNGLYSADGSINYESVTTWMGNNAMGSRWWISTVMLILACVIAAAVGVFALTRMMSKLTISKKTGEEKKPFIALSIGTGSILLSFVVTLVAVLMYDKIAFNYLQFGAMDYMYLICYGGISLMLAAAMWCGYSFSKFGAVALFILIASNNFSSIFNVFGARTSKVNEYLNQGVKFVGYNYIISAVLYILSIVICLGIIAVFAVKEVKDYMYQKRYS